VPPGNDVVSFVVVGRICHEFGYQKVKLKSESVYWTMPYVLAVTGGVVVAVPAGEYVCWWIRKYTPPPTISSAITMSVHIQTLPYWFFISSIIAFWFSQDSN
jgi:hypothetical protein